MPYIHNGNDYAVMHPVSRVPWDARNFAILQGAAKIQKLLIAQHILNKDARYKQNGQQALSLDPHRNIWIEDPGNGKITQALEDRTLMTYKEARQKACAFWVFGAAIRVVFGVLVIISLSKSY